LKKKKFNKINLNIVENSKYKMKSKRQSAGGPNKACRISIVPERVENPESLFEANLAVLSDILGLQHIYQHLVIFVNQILRDNGVKVDISGQQVRSQTEFPRDLFPHNELGDGKKIIFWYQGKSTHYRVCEYGTERVDRRGQRKRVPYTIDPYKLYQKDKTHGFCQMFALFIAKSDQSDFIDIREGEPVLSQVSYRIDPWDGDVDAWRLAQDKREEIATIKDIEERKRQTYIENDYICLNKTVVLIRKMTNNYASNEFNIELNKRIKEDLATGRHTMVKENPDGKQIPVEPGDDISTFTFEQFVKDFPNTREDVEKWHANR